MERRTAKATRQGAEVTHLTASAGQKGPEPERSSTSTSSAPRLRYLQTHDVRAGARRPAGRERRRKCPSAPRMRPGGCGCQGDGRSQELLVLATGELERASLAGLDGWARPLGVPRMFFYLSKKVSFPAGAIPSPSALRPAGDARIHRRNSAS